ncbi:hypothetical protein GGR50DRAFT_414974 [Xylaria sp. CBS 124048]|nr:hypothetical protein GGR50DRAFT_414974 [Xylaria sp. CBS 124048]
MPTTRAAEKASAAKDGHVGDESEAAGSKRQAQEKVPPSKRAKTDDHKEHHVTEEKKPAAGNGHKRRKSKEEPKASKVKKEDATEGQEQKNDTAIEPDARQGTVPTNILEKGIIYFFFRGRVGVEDPSNVDEIQRSYMILRPLNKDAKLGEGTIPDLGNSRLIAVPKKVFPRSGRDRWIAFVEKSHASLDTLKESFLSSTDYETKTVGTRHAPAATPAAEGIYAITTTGRESHLAYVITLPSEFGEVQDELGLRQKGSFIISTRNPQYEAPRGTRLPKGPDYPKEVHDEFRGLRWMPSQPNHLDYANTQFLLIGESSGIEKATAPPKEDKEKDEKEKPVEELEKLEDEDTHRMEGLEGDDSVAIFDDLGALAQDYPKLKTSF